ncbi:MAG TPA: hypothetical protein PKB12_10665 [Elusimicrobiota bacterium]|jgi:putative Mn2+ efflux pump MntP|nr:hypothetical protein [Elusimicrobiota bacterium]HMU96212.1 hypothetical protein [Elusimicrobiota bacterium]HMX44168.1 hypothetical protein [Elusimicrobiota bacterium]HNC74544.1 hypothetical protein [Elusimicrobiota bacterium]
MVTSKSKAVWVALIASGLFAAVVMMLGLLWQKKVTEYAKLAAGSYILSTIGFLFLVGWTFFRGDLNDVEAPKHRVLKAETDDAD